MLGLIAAVVVIVVVLAALAAIAAFGVLPSLARRRQADDEAARDAASGQADAGSALAARLAQGGRGDAMAALAAIRRHLRGELAPVVAAGLRNPSPRVAEQCAQALGELGAPGLRTAWSAYETPGVPEAARRHLREFVLRHSDWLFQQLFERWQSQGAAGTVPHPDLWRDAGLRQHLVALTEMADEHVAPSAQALLGRLRTDGTAPGGAAAPAAD